MFRRDADYVDLWGISSLTPLCCFGYSGLEVIAPRRGCLDTKSRACHIFLLFLIYFLQETACCFCSISYLFWVYWIEKFSDVRSSSLWWMWVTEVLAGQIFLGLKLLDAVFIQDYFNICKVFRPGYCIIKIQDFHEGISHHFQNV